MMLKMSIFVRAFYIAAADDESMNFRPLGFRMFAEDAESWRSLEFERQRMVLFDARMIEA